MDFAANMQNSSEKTPARSVSAGTSVRILGHYVRDLSFVSPEGPINEQAEQPTLNLEIGLNQDRKSATKYELAVHITAKASTGTTNMYDLKLVFAGMFEFSGLSDDQIQAVLHVNCPAILFPYYRQLLGDITRAGGFAPVWLDPIDWGSVYADRIKMSEMDS